jgi:hypothetical protein
MDSSYKGYSCIDEKLIVSQASSLGKEIETCIEGSYLKEYDTFLMSPRMVSGSIAIIHSMNKIDEFCQVLLSILEYDVDSTAKIKWAKQALMNKVDEVSKTNGFIKNSMNKHGIDVELV